MDARSRGFTLIELLIVVALIGVVLTLAGPAFYDFILLQRLKGINAQLVTDLQLARGEAVSRNVKGRIVFASNSSMSCYTLYTLKVDTNMAVRCNCLLGPGAACANPLAIENKTVQVPTSLGVRVVVTVGSPPGLGLPPTDPAVAFDPVTGGLVSIPSDDFPDPVNEFVVETSIDSPRKLRTSLNRAGRPTVCGTAANLGTKLCE